jgi:hypothetical protein
MDPLGISLIALVISVSLALTNGVAYCRARRELENALTLGS